MTKKIQQLLLASIYYHAFIIIHIQQTVDAFSFSCSASSNSNSNSSGSGRGDKITPLFLSSSSIHTKTNIVSSKLVLYASSLSTRSRSINANAILASNDDDDDDEGEEVAKKNDFSSSNNVRLEERNHEKNYDHQITIISSRIHEKNDQTSTKTKKNNKEITATATKNYDNERNKNRNISLDEIMTLLSRAFEVGSVALSTTTPLLISGLSSTVFSNNGQKDYLLPKNSINSSSSTIHTSNTRSNSNNVKDEDVVVDLWDQFWSLHTSKSTGIPTTTNNEYNKSPTNTSTTTTTRDTKNNDTISNAERIVQGLQILGPTYVKFGQALSARPDIIPPSLANALTKLQDDMEPFDTNLAKSIIENELLLQPRRREQFDIDNGGTGNRNNKHNDIMILDNDNDDDAHVVENIEDIQCLIDSLSEAPVAAASVGQVYKGYLPNYGPVAVKVQRPEVKSLVQKDLSLLRTFAQFVESIPSIDNINLNLIPSNQKSNAKKDDDALIVLDNASSFSSGKRRNRLVNTELVSAVDEFMSRIFEELDYSNEAKNAKTFAQLYCKKNGSRVKSLPNGQGVIVPQIISSLCTNNVLVMEWIEGSKLTTLKKNDDNIVAQPIVEDQIPNPSPVELNGSCSNVDDDDSLLKENLALIEQALYVTLSQLLDTGVMHADPHGEWKQKSTSNLMGITI